MRDEVRVHHVDLPGRGGGERETVHTPASERESERATERAHARARERGKGRKRVCVCEKWRERE